MVKEGEGRGGGADKVDENGHKEAEAEEVRVGK